MSHAVLDQLTKANRPDQFGLLERATDLLTASTTVTHLLVRGSLATGTTDRLSDVDFVVGVEDRFFFRVRLGSRRIGISRLRRDPAGMA